MQPPSPPQIVNLLTDLSGTDIAYIALWVSAAAALTALVGSIVVALVNAVAARYQARAVARREYRMKTLQPVLDYTEAVMKGHELVYFAIRAPDDELQEAVRQANSPFAGLGGLGLVMRTPSLKNGWTAFKKAEQPLHQLIGKTDNLRAHRENLTPVESKYDEGLKPLRKATMDFRNAVENFVF